MPMTNPTPRLPIQLLRAFYLSLLTLILLSISARAQDPDKPAQVQLDDLTKMYLEDLMHAEIPSVSRQRESLSKAAAAVFVITLDELLTKIQHASLAPAPRP
jgi:hypothetical protein